MPENSKPDNMHYIHRISSTVQQRIVGIFVLSPIIVITGLILYQIQSSHLFDDRINYHAFLTNAQGISTETQIRISGIEVGLVKSIDITPDNRIHVQFFVYDSFQRLIRTDSTGELNKLSVIGNAAIIITAGSHKLPILPADATIPIEEPVTIDDLVARLTPVVTNLNDIVNNVDAIVAAIEPDRLKSTTEDFSELMSNMRKISEQITEGKGMVGKILYDEKLAQELSGAIHDIRPIVKDVQPIVNNVGQIVREVENDMRLVENILLETEQRVKEISLVLKPASTLAQKSNVIADDIQSTTGVVSEEIQQLPDMVKKMQSLLDSANQTIRNAQEIWPLSTVIPAGNKETLIMDQPLDD